MLENFRFECINRACIFEITEQRITTRWSRIWETHCVEVSSCCTQNKYSSPSFGLCFFRRGAVVSDEEVIYYGRLCASRHIYYTGDAVLEVEGQVKCAIAQVEFEKSHEELWLHVCVWIKVCWYAHHCNYPKHQRRHWTESSDAVSYTHLTLPTRRTV